MFSSKSNRQANQLLLSGGLGSLITVALLSVYFLLAKPCGTRGSTVQDLLSGTGAVDSTTFNAVNAGAGARCAQTSVEYFPSAMEQAWAVNGSLWGSSQKAYCDKMTQPEQKKATAASQASVAQINKAAIQSSASAGRRLLLLPSQLARRVLAATGLRAAAVSTNQAVMSATESGIPTYEVHLPLETSAAATMSLRRQLLDSSALSSILDVGGDSASTHPQLSRFVHSYTCSGGGHDGPWHLKVTSPIEPLFAALRNPEAIPCDPASLAEPGKRPQELGVKLMDVEFLLLSTKPMPKPGHPLYLPHRRAFYFDAGASSYGEISQKWMLEAYEKRGVIFERIVGWEANVMAPDKIFAEVPPRFMAAYSYFNIPLNTDLADTARNPLALIKHITHPDDFVVFKLDIDNGAIENTLLKQIIADPEIYTRIDELYHEPHFNFEHLVKCCWGDTADKGVDLQGALKQFQALRQLGIRAHGWP